MAVLRQELKILAIVFVSLATCAQTAGPPCCPDATDIKQLLLREKLESTIRDVDRDLNGVLGVAILDLTSSEQSLLHADEVFAQASSIKIAVLAELYRQAQQGKLRLPDLYTVEKSDLVPGSDIMGGLTPGVTRVTLRDLATMMIAVSDNSATNVLIDRVGMDNVNAMLAGLGLKNTRLRRKMMDINAAKQGRENISTPREMMALLEAVYRGKLFNPELTADFIKMLATHKHSPIRKAAPDAVVSADKPGELEGVRADSGIVYAQNRPFVICVMSAYLKDEAAGEAAIGKIAAAAYDYFDRLGRSSAYGRTVSPYNSHP
ncbi:MAG: class A beta-lactamase-related serine hydrolase [Acidobacteriia bacterium]|nr:class A beta-lactamase-related serine hydrolase [Terriglobia bacterium]